MADAALATARSALRYNVRTLAPAAPGVPAIDGLAVEGLAVEGLTAGQIRALERSVRGMSGHVVTDPEGRGAVLVGTLTALGGVAAGLVRGGGEDEQLGSALSAALLGRHPCPPLRCGDRLLQFGRASCRERVSIDV